MVPAPAPVLIHELAETLWYERRLLEFLLFKLVSANLVLAGEDHRFIAPAMGEVERVVSEVRRAEMKRDEVLAAVSREWDVPLRKLSLSYLADHAPADVRDDFVDHQTGFMDLVNEIEDLTRENRRLAGVGLDSIRDTLGLAEGLTYDSAGKRDRPGGSPIRVDRVL